MCGNLGRTRGTTGGRGMSVGDAIDMRSSRSEFGVSLVTNRV